MQVNIDMSVVVAAQPPRGALTAYRRSSNSNTDTELMIQHHHRAVQELSDEQKEEFRRHAAASFAASTRRNYESDHRCFVLFLEQMYPNNTTAARLIDPATGLLDERRAAWTDAILWIQQMVQDNKKLSTINRRWSYLRAHLIPDLSRMEIHDEYQQILAGIRKQLDDGQMKGKRPLLMKHVHAIVELLSSTVGHDVRQRRTLLLFGFHSAMRRSELRAMRWNDVEFKPAGACCSHSRVQDRRWANHHAEPTPRGSLSRSTARAVEKTDKGELERLCVSNRQQRR